MNTVIPGFWYLNQKKIEKKFLEKKYKLYSFDAHNIKYNLKNWERIQDSYTSILKELSQILNNIHQLNWKTKTWEIIVGPWLKKYLVVIFDRVFITKCNIKNKNKFFFAEDQNKTHLNSYDINDFLSQILKDQWNEEFFKRLYKFYKYKDEKYLLKKEIKIEEKIKFSKIHEGIFLLINFFLKIYCKIFCKKSVFIFSRTYFGKKSIFIKFIMSLKEFPLIYFLNDKKINLTFDKKIRDKIKFKKTINEKENIAKILIKECLPRIYLEGFKYVQDRIRLSSLPQKKSLIFLSNIRNDSMFKFWVAGQKEIGSKLIVAQHGGGYNMFKFDESLDYELKIADIYLSWGWKKNIYNKKNVLPFGILNQNIRPVLKKNNKEGISLILGAFYRYIDTQDPRCILNLTKSDKNLNFTELMEIEYFCKGIKPKFSKFITIRPHPSKMRFSGIYAFEKKLKGIFKFNRDYSISGEKFMRNFKLNIFHELHSTSFAFALALDLPSLVICPHNINYFNNETQKILSLMLKAKIVHKHHKSAVKFVNQVYNNPSQWWNSKITQLARKKFCKTHGKYSNNYNYKKLTNILLLEKQRLSNSESFKMR